jgi:hypothetical protein
MATRLKGLMVRQVVTQVACRIPNAGAEASGTISSKAIWHRRRRRTGIDASDQIKRGGSQPQGRPSR